MANITSKELGLIEDNVRQEQLKIQKFDLYASQATDPDIIDPCQNLCDMHQQHYLINHLNRT